jgi:hypothetical protein
MVATERIDVRLYDWLTKAPVQHTPYAWSAVPTKGSLVMWSDPEIGVRRQGEVCEIVWCEGQQYSKFLSAKVIVYLRDIMEPMYSRGS